MTALGVFRPPVVRKNDTWVRAMDLTEVAKLLGIKPPDHTILPPDKLYEKLEGILAAAHRYTLALPNDKLSVTVPRREKRNLRELSYHIFAIPIDYIEIKDGENYTQGNKPIPESVQTVEHIAAYGEQVQRRMAAWFAAQTEATWPRILSTQEGAFSMHLYFERAIWHAGQHTRQLAAMLQNTGVAPPEPLPDSFFQGLPMPERLWE